MTRQDERPVATYKNFCWTKSCNLCSKSHSRQFLSFRKKCLMGLSLGPPRSKCEQENESKEALEVEWAHFFKASSLFRHYLSGAQPESLNARIWSFNFTSFLGSCGLCSQVFNAYKVSPGLWAWAPTHCIYRVLRGFVEMTKWLRPPGWPFEDRWIEICATVGLWTITVTIKN